MLPRQQHTNYLVSGYVHQHCVVTFPIVLIRLILLHFNSILYWNFKGEKLHKLLSMKNGDSIYSKTFKIKDIVFHCSLCPNGWRKEEEGYVMFYIEIKSHPINVSDVVIHYKLCCHQTNTFFQTTKHIKSSRGWVQHTLALSECSDKDELSFGCYVEVLQIKYKNDTKTYYKPDVKLNCKYRAEWKIDDELLDTFKSLTKAKEKYYFARLNAIGHNQWRIICVPHWSDDDTPPFYFGVGVLRLPPNVKSIKVNFKRSILYDDETNLVDLSNDIVLSYFGGESGERGASAYPCEFKKSVKDIQKLTFNVEINIIGLYDVKGNEIPACDWNKYGIV